MSRCLASRPSRPRPRRRPIWRRGPSRPKPSSVAASTTWPSSAGLTLLEAGPRPEEVEAQEARLARLFEEVRHLDGLRERLLIRSPGPGQVTSTRPREQVGHFYREGDPILVVQELDCLEVEISVTE